MNTQNPNIFYTQKSLMSDYQKDERKALAKIAMVATLALLVAGYLFVSHMEFVNATLAVAK